MKYPHLLLASKWDIAVYYTPPFPMQKPVTRQLETKCAFQRMSPYTAANLLPFHSRRAPERIRGLLTLPRVPSQTATPSKISTLLEGQALFERSTLLRKVAIRQRPQMGLQSAADQAPDSSIGG